MESSVSNYHNSGTKRLFDLIASVSGLIILSPIILSISILIRITDRGPVLFRQKRTGIKGKPFILIKFRSMRPGAQKEQKKYESLNEADGPVFKIENDPRFTKIGRFLAKTGLDELPQLINVLKGEMSLVGPRPLPVYEAAKLSQKQKIRGLIKPGITSTWVVKGAHRLTFKKWMELDREYIFEAGLFTDLDIFLRTGILIPKLITSMLDLKIADFRFLYSTSLPFATAFWLIIFLLTLFSGYFILQIKGISIIDAYSFK